MTADSYLSTKDIPVSERLIFALDVADNETAKALVEELGDAVTFYKIGLELFMGGEYFEMIRWLKERDKKIFVDLKFFDVPETVRKAVRQLKKYGVTFATVHGNQNMLSAAAAEETGVKILGVTVLTSCDQDDIEDLGFKDVEIKDIVLSRARRTLEAGCHGVISSGLEAAELRAELGDRLLIISPGIRPVANVDDQKRTVSVEQAFVNGADYIVVGRPISKADDPRAAALAIQQQISTVFS